MKSWQSVPKTQTKPLQSSWSTAKFTSAFFLKKRQQLICLKLIFHTKKSTESFFLLNSSSWFTTKPPHSLASSTAPWTSGLKLKSTKRQTTSSWSSAAGVRWPTRFLAFASWWKVLENSLRKWKMKSRIHIVWSEKSTSAQLKFQRQKLKFWNDGWVLQSSLWRWLTRITNSWTRVCLF